jgi:hypothetical protein
MKAIDEIEPKQMTLFEISSLGKSSLIKAESSAIKSTREEKINVSTLNKLGKNQLLKKIETISNNSQIIEKISPRYVYVVDFDYKSMMARLYCLSKGIEQVILVDKAAYKKLRLNKGNLVYCSRFSKKDGLFILAEYKITDKIEEEIPVLMEE